MTPQGTRRSTEPDPGASHDPSATPPPPRAGAVAAEPGARMLQPIRWPKPERAAVRLMALYAVGVLVAVVPAALVVPPGDDSAATGRLFLAFGLTLVGIAIMVAATVVLYRRSREVGHLVLAVVPTGVMLAGGMMLLGTKLPL